MSPPPVRAATSMFLISLANILLRLASTTAFLCFVVAHLEWPDITSLLLGRARPPSGARRRQTSDCGAANHVDEVPVHAGVPGDLRVERRREQVPLPHRDNPTRGRPHLHLGEDLDLLAHLLDPWRPDEHGPDRWAVDAGEPQILLEAGHL